MHLVTLHNYQLFTAVCRSELSLQPITKDDADNQVPLFECSEGFSYEDVCNQHQEVHLQQTCLHRGNQLDRIMINIVPLKDTVTFNDTGGIGENFDMPLVLHLWPFILLRNLLPYSITYELKVRAKQPRRNLLGPIFNLP